VTRKPKPPAINNHPLLKFIGKKYTQPKRESFCSKPAQRHSSVHSNDYSISIDKHKQGSLYKKPQLSINKHEISLRGEHTGDINSKERRAQRTGGDRVSTKQEEGRKEEQWTMKTVKKQKEDSPRSSESYGLTEEEE
jgi:hypothetical protein